jgi:hypothetical protein
MNVLLLALLMLASCMRATTPPVEIAQDPSIGSIAIASVAIAPAQATGEELSAGATRTVADLLASATARAGTWRMVEPPVGGGATADETAAARAGRVATAAKADAGLVAEVSRFRERVGGDLGVSEAASVAIRILLVPAGRAQPVWRADYVFTQEPLAYNLWNFWQVQRGGVKWLTAAEIAKIGIDEAIGRLTGQPVSDR